MAWARRDGVPSTIWGLVDERAAATPDALFAVDQDGRALRFGELATSAERVAAGLQEQGVGPATVVAWQLPNWLESAMLSLALCRLGATQVPLVAMLRHREVSFICRQTRAELLVTPGIWRGFDYRSMATALTAALPALRTIVAERHLPEADPGGLPPAPVAPSRWLYYTSGTTAEPKGAIHSDPTLLAAAIGFLRALRITDGDRLTMVIPFTHIGGVVHLLTALTTGCSLVFCEVFDPERTTQQLRDQHATILPGGLPFAQAFFAFQDQHPELDPLFPDARLMIHGGSPKPRWLHTQVKQRLCPSGVISGYGMTECPMLAWSTPDDPDDDIATSEGRPVPGVEVIAVAPDGTPLGPGEPGELRVRGPQLMAGYVDAALDATAFDAQGYFCTGDVGYLSARGRVVISGRSKDVIIRNMENIAAAEIEELLLAHPAVRDVAVIGVADPVTGERVCAVVVPEDPDLPPSLEELNAHLDSVGLSRHKLPERLEVVADLPRNAMGKLRKAELRRQFA